MIARAPKKCLLYVTKDQQRNFTWFFKQSEEIGNSKFCIIVDEDRDESMKELMVIVLRFVDKDGFIWERFYGLVHVSNTVALTLKNGIYSPLSHHNLDIQNTSR